MVWRKQGKYDKQNAYEFFLLSANSILLQMQIFIIWESIEAKSQHRLWPDRDPPGISQGENHLTTVGPYDLKYIGCFLREDLFHLTRAIIGIVLISNL